MGNCQAAEGASVVIQHPTGRVERVYWSVSASHVMTSNPGHYVAVIVTSSSSAHAPAPVKYLKLLRPDDTLLIGHVYRLVSFEEVLKEFASKKRVKLSRLLVSSNNKEKKKISSGAAPDVNINPDHTSPPLPAVQVVEAGHVEVETEDSSSSRSGGPVVSRAGQWRPALQSIAEFGIAS